MTVNLYGRSVQNCDWPSDPDQLSGLCTLPCERHGRREARLSDGSLISSSQQLIPRRIVKLRNHKGLDCSGPLPVQPLSGKGAVDFRANLPRLSLRKKRKALSLYPRHAEYRVLQRGKSDALPAYENPAAVGFSFPGCSRLSVF